MEYVVTIFRLKPEATHRVCGFKEYVASGFSRKNWRKIKS